MNAYFATIFMVNPVSALQMPLDQCFKLSDSLLAKLQALLLIELITKQPLALSLLLIAAIVFSIISSIYMFSSNNHTSGQGIIASSIRKAHREQNTKQQEAFARAMVMLDSTPICSMLWDGDGSIFDCNEESVRLFGLSSKKDFIDNFYRLSPNNQPDGQLSTDKAHNYVELALETGEVKFDWQHQKLDGTIIPCEISLVRIEYDNHFVVAAYARDLREHQKMMEELLRLQTELKGALQQAQEANEAKSSFLATMSHEMRTPLNAVIGFSELILSSDDVGGDIEDKLAKIYASGITLLNIVNDILDISKIESGKFELISAAYDTTSLINDIATQNIVRIGEKPIDFKLVLDENLPEKMIGDELRVKQVFNNILSNAIKYTNAGVVEWTVSFEEDDSGFWLVSSVRDTGVGIKPEDMSKLFRDYSQVETTANRRTDGTGLGLAITKRYVDMMGGSITASSEFGVGSIFSVRLKQEVASNTVIGKEATRQLTINRYSDNKRMRNANFARINMSYASVLVVDDVAVNIDVVKGMLKPYQVKVESAMSGAVAIEMIRAEKTIYDAVFMDHMMPEIDGVEAVRIIRNEINTDYAKTVPIIALTANAVVGSEKMFLENGFQAFVSKPIDINRLDAVLRQYVRDKKQEAALDNELAEPVNSNTATAQSSYSFNASLLNGVDVISGLARFGNDEESYIDVVRSYAGSTGLLLEKLSDFVSTDDMPNYAITVHGVKGASRAIGAVLAGTEAERLEHLAKDGDSAAVLAGHTPFIELVQAVIDSVDMMLANYDSLREKPTAREPDVALLDELQAACLNYDISRVDEAMQQLESYEYENGSELVTWLREQIEDMSFDEISNGEWLKQYSLAKG